MSNKITTENLAESEFVGDAIEFSRRVALGWLALRERGVIKNCECKKIPTIDQLTKVRKTVGGWNCQYILTRRYPKNNSNGEIIHEFAVWSSVGSGSEIVLYNKFGDAVQFSAIGLALRPYLREYCLGFSNENQASACDCCEIDFLIQEAFQHEVVF